MAQVILTKTYQAPREHVWAAIDDVMAHGRFVDGMTCTDVGDGRRRTTFAGIDMTEAVLSRKDNDELTLGAVEFHEAPFKHFVTSFRLAGPEGGPTSLAIAIDFAGGFAGLRAKGTVQRTYQALLDGIEQAQPVVTVTA